MATGNGNLVNSNYYQLALGIANVPGVSWVGPSLSGGLGPVVRFQIEATRGVYALGRIAEAAHNTQIHVVGRVRPPTFVMDVPDGGFPDLIKAIEDIGQEMRQHDDPEVPSS